MSNINEQNNLEGKIRNDKNFWSIFLFFLIFLISIVFILFLIDSIPKTPDTETTPGPETIGKTYSFDSILIGIVLFMLGIIFLVTTTGFARSYHAGKIVTPLFRDCNINKSSHLTELVKLKNDVEIEIQWSNKGYFTLEFGKKPVGYAKSAELQWKILFVSHKLSIK